MNQEEYRDLELKDIKDGLICMYKAHNHTSLLAVDGPEWVEFTWPQSHVLGNIDRMPVSMLCRLVNNGVLKVKI